MTPSTSATEEALECRRTNAVRHGGVVTGQSSMCSGAFGVCSDGALQCLVGLVKNRDGVSLSLLYTPTTCLQRGKNSALSTHIYIWPLRNLQRR